jgi:hypothetical protein
MALSQPHEIHRPIVLVRRESSVLARREVYYKTEIHGAYRNPLAFGAGRRLGRGASIELFHLHPNGGYSDQGGLNGLGMNIKDPFLGC